MNTEQGKEPKYKVGDKGQEERIKKILHLHHWQMSYQQVGEILTLADQVGHEAYEKASEFITGCRTKEAAEEYKDLLINQILSNE